LFAGSDPEVGGKLPEKEGRNQDVAEPALISKDIIKKT
jgi:hypothetical protein